jgi:hypothetical protein
MALSCLPGSGTRPARPSNRYPPAVTRHAGRAAPSR